MKGPGLTDRINAFCRLGDIMKEACKDKPHSEAGGKLRSIARQQQEKNSWFTPRYVFESISALADILNIENLTLWTQSYNIADRVDCPKRIGVIMAGNIPLVGFHDLLCVLITGNIFIGKTSSKDSELIGTITSILTDIEPRLKDYIILKEDTIDNFNAVIATGSNNSSRYFEYYFGSKPHIFRNNRNSVALIHSDTKDSDLEKLGKDVFYYFGLGCRNVSKIFLPSGFKIERLKKAWTDYADHINIIPYHNNYKYNKAIFRLENSKYHDLDFILLRENPGLSSPVSVLYYSIYEDEREIWADINLRIDQIQTIVGKGHTPFGRAQSPSINDYADGIDTIDFLLNLS